MSDFLDINPVASTVEINGKKYPVPGISMEGFGHLIPRFPDLVSQMQTRLAKDGSLSLLTIIEVAGPATGAILAAGLGYPGNDKAEKTASMLDATTQVEILDKIIERTMPRGIGPFVAQWPKLMERFATPQQKVEKMLSKVSQKRSTASSATVTNGPTVGL